VHDIFDLSVAIIIVVHIGGGGGQTGMTGGGDDIDWGSSRCLRNHGGCLSPAQTIATANKWWLGYHNWIAQGCNIVNIIYWKFIDLINLKAYLPSPKRQKQTINSRVSFIMCSSFNADCNFLHQLRILYSPLQAEINKSQFPDESEIIP